MAAAARHGRLAGRVLGARASCGVGSLGRLNARSVRAGAARGGYSFRYSRSRRVCVRLTGISVAFSSFILRM